MDAGIGDDDELFLAEKSSDASAAAGMQSHFALLPLFCSFSVSYVSYVSYESFMSTIVQSYQPDFDLTAHLCLILVISI